MKYTHQLIKINQVVCSLYLPQKPYIGHIVYAKGGPSFADNGDSPVAKVAIEYGYTLLIPDYIGYSRSEGKFTFKNCVKTIDLCNQFLEGKIHAVDDQNRPFSLKSKHIINIGSSWGGAIVPFTKKSKYIGLIKPLTNWKNQHSGQFIEENVKDTSKQIMSLWKNIYRGFNKSEWPRIFSGKESKYNPIDQVSLLADKKIVIVVHGRHDTTINIKKSQEYVNELTKLTPLTTKLIITNGDHSTKTNISGFRHIIKQITKYRGGE